MRKSIIVILIAFIALLVPGVLLNAQTGIRLGDAFYRKTGEWEYTRAGDTISCARSEDGYAFTLTVNGVKTTGALCEIGDGAWRADFPGWSMETLKNDPMSGIFTSVDGIVYIGEAELILTDLEQAGCRFVKAVDTVTEPFWDETGKEVGETAFLILETGESVYLGETWYGNEAALTPEQNTVTLTDGVRVRAENASTAIFRNEAGEYLINAEDLFVTRFGGVQISKESLLALMRSVASANTQTRGSMAVLIPYAAVYLLGACAFLWPEKLYFLGSRWAYRSEPALSDAGIAMQKLGGILTMAAAVVVLYVTPYA